MENYTGSDFFMRKRGLCVFFLLVLAFTGIGIRLAFIGSEIRETAMSQTSQTVDITRLRGTVYDCNLQPLTNGENCLYAAAKPSVYALSQLKGKVLPEVFDSVAQRMGEGRPVAVRIDAPVEENGDIIQLSVPERYDSRSLACHIIGSVGDGKGISGIEKAYDGLLSESGSTVRVRFPSNARGRVMLGEEITLEGGNADDGIVLTIDKNIQLIAENALDESGAKCGAAVVIEIESGAVRACVSRPSYNQNNLAESLDNPDSPLINRALLPFSVGSVFKPVVAAAALETGISEGFSYNCTGSVTYNGVTFNCHKKEGHGVLNMEDAVAFSCNTYFTALANETGRERIVETAEDFGFGKEISLAEGIFSASGHLPDKDELDSRAALANLSFGQGSLTATPLQICAAMAAIGGGGVYIRPSLVEGELRNGEIIRIRSYSEKKRVISPLTAEMLKGFLEKVVSEGSGKRAASESVTAAGKTATAQTGKSIGGEEIYNAWFAGYFPAEKPEYAVAVLVENGGEGALSCAPIFGKIAEKVTAYSSEKE